MQLYGGMVNEEIFYNAVDVTAGAYNDIEKISQFLKVMVGEVGFYQQHKLNYSVINKSGEMRETQIKMIEDVSAKLYAETQRALMRHKELTNILVERPMQEYVLNVDDALNIVKEYFETHLELLDQYLLYKPKLLSA